MAAQRALMDAYADPSKRGMLTPDQVALAQRLLGGAQGQALVPKASVVSGHGTGGQGSPKEAPPFFTGSDVPKVSDASGYAALPAGARYMAPDGKIRIKQK